MEWALAGLVAIVPLGLAIGAITGRVRVRACCSVPAEQDRRLQA